MTVFKYISAAISCAGLALASSWAVAGNNIAHDLASVEVNHKGKSVKIVRSDVKGAVIPAAYTKISRPCPPFCIQPIKIAKGVETVGELEVIKYLNASQPGNEDLIGTPPVLVVDSRTPEWVGRGTIPGSINIPWTKISVDERGGFPLGEDLGAFTQILINQFGANKVGEIWDYSKAKTLVLFCNGNWCGQSAANIKTLLRLGYPAEKIKWYRGGMQSWIASGLSTVNE